MQKLKTWASDVDGIRNALEVVCRLANEHLENLDRRDDDWLVLTSIVDHDGALNVAARDKLVMSICGIARETALPGLAPQHIPTGGANYAVVNPPLYIDLQLIFMANFTERKYPEGLAAISRLIGFFQQTPVFNQTNAQALDPAIGQLTLEFLNLSSTETNFVMSMLGTRYLPSVFYKLRMIPFVSDAARARAMPVRGPGEQRRA